MRSTKLPSWISGPLGLDAGPVPPHVFAIDGRQLSYGRFAPAERTLELLEHRTIELPAELFNEGPLGGVVTDASALSAAVAEVLEGLSVTVDSASLVLPDSWLRVAFAETGDLPRSSRDREQVLRWQLKRLVPFRVEDLRLNAVEVEPLPNQPEKRRLLLGFAMEHLLSHLEDAFGEHEVHLGHISNQSLSLLAGLRGALSGAELGAFVHVQEGSYALVAARHGEPAVHRFKSVNGSLPEEAQEGLVQRDLRLTRVFLSEHTDAQLGRLILVCPRQWEETWRLWLEEIFEVAVSTLSAEWEFGGNGGEAAVELAPLFGAARREAR